MEKVRGFEVAKGFEDKGINLPIRKTKYSAGYDIEAAEDCIIPAFKPGQAPTLVKTGLKAYMPEDEYLMLCNRSSNPKKKGLVMANSIGIIDNSYSGDNDVWMFPAIALEDTKIEKGDRICQFRIVKSMPKVRLDEVDHLDDQSRGGFGSTGVK